MLNWCFRMTFRVSMKKNLVIFISIIFVFSCIAILQRSRVLPNSSGAHLPAGRAAGSRVGAVPRLHRKSGKLPSTFNHIKCDDDLFDRMRKHIEDRKQILAAETGVDTELKLEPDILAEIDNGKYGFFIGNDTGPTEGDGNWTHFEINDAIFSHKLTVTELSPSVKQTEGTLGFQSKSLRTGVGPYRYTAGGFSVNLKSNHIHSKRFVQSLVKVWPRNYHNMKRYKFVMNEGSICEPDNQRHDVDLLVLVASGEENLVARMAIRQTWSTVTVPGYRIVTLFVVGLPSGEPPIREYRQSVLELEHILYHDMIQINFIDTYKNLTIKTISMLRWVDEFCPNSTFMVKADDDVYLNFTRLLRLLQDLPYKNRLYMGHYFNESTVLRFSKSKWYVPRRIFGEEKLYPPYMCGTTYVLSTDAAKQLYHVSQKCPFFWFEDVFIGILSGLLNLAPTPMNDEFFTSASTRTDLKNNITLCTYTSRTMAHTFTPTMIRKMHKGKC